MKTNLKNIRYMLKESNAIEDVYDNSALIEAGRAWRFIMQYEVVTPYIIKETHRILMKGQPLDEKYVGAWRPIPVSIGGKRKDDPPIVIDSKIHQWCTLMNESKLSSIDLHVQFEDIHPFVDGNGRMGRIAMNWRQVKSKAPLIIFTKADVQDYYKLFKPDPWEERLRILKDIRNNMGSI